MRLVECHGTKDKTGRKGDTMNISEQRQKLREQLAILLYKQDEGTRYRGLFEDRANWYQDEFRERADTILAYLHSQGVVLSVEGREDDTVRAVMAAPIIEETA